jgi:sorbitol-specific phosphotransferase system component IIC
MSERTEALMRIIVIIVTGIILGIWKILIQIFIVINFIWTIISGSRIRDLAELSEMWNTQIYVFLRYITFVSNERPMPFNKMTKNFSKYEK